MRETKIYQGSRKDGVTVDGKPLFHHAWHSPTGFEWGYGGSGPADLALSILADYAGLPYAERYYQKFKWDIIAQLPYECWTITSDDIERWKTKSRAL